MRMELAAALQHSAPKSAGSETNDALRSQKMADRRFRSHGTDSRKTCAAGRVQDQYLQRIVEPGDGGTVGGRAGALLSESGVGGVVGGSAAGRVSAISRA